MKLEPQFAVISPQVTKENPSIRRRVSSTTWFQAFFPSQINVSKRVNEVLEYRFRRTVLEAYRVSACQNRPRSATTGHSHKPAEHNPHKTL